MRGGPGDLDRDPGAPMTAARMDIGIGFTPFETRADVVLRLARLAEARGLDRVDIAEGWTDDATILLAQLATETERIALGTGVLSIWGRTPATMAMTATGLQRCSSGRFTLGLGAGSPPLTEGFHGVEWDRPGRKLRQTLTAVRALLAGERLPEPSPASHPLRLGVLPEVPVPLALGALSPASIRLAGELADVWIPFLWARSQLADGRALLREGEALADAASPPTKVRVAVPVALGPDEQHAQRQAAWWLSSYTTRMGPLYPRLLGERFGFSAGVEAVVRAAAAGGDTALPPAAQDLADDVTLKGTYDQLPSLLSSWSDAGADNVSLVLPPGRPEEELTLILEVVADAVSGGERDGSS